MGFLDELKKLTKPYDDDDEYYGDDDYDEGGEDESASHTRRSPAVVDDNTPAYGASSDSYSPVSTAGGNRVVNINASTQLQVVLVRPDSFDSVGQIADHLRERRAVLLNLEERGPAAGRLPVRLRLCSGRQDQEGGHLHLSCDPLRRGHHGRRDGGTGKQRHVFLRDKRGIVNVYTAADRSDHL